MTGKPQHEIELELERQAIRLGLAPKSYVYLINRADLHKRAKNLDYFDAGYALGEEHGFWTGVQDAGEYWP